MKARVAMGGGRLLFGVFAGALLVVATVANAAAGEASTATSVVVGMAKCADCSRKDMNTEAAFKGLLVAIKCKNSSGAYESRAIGSLDGSGAFTVPLADDLHGVDCVAQLHSAASTPCPGQEPSKIVPLAGGTGTGTSTFVAIAGKAHYPSAECASAIMCYPCGKKPGLLGHFHKQKPDFLHRHKKPFPEYQPPSPDYGQPAPECPPPTPEYGQPAPECPPPTPGYGEPAPECPPPTPAYGQPAPECPPATPGLGQPAPECPPPTPECPPATPGLGQPAPECPPPTPAYGQPAPEYPPPTPAYGQPAPECTPPTPSYGKPAPDCPPSTPVYGQPPAPECPPESPVYAPPTP